MGADVDEEVEEGPAPVPVDVVQQEDARAVAVVPRVMGLQVRDERLAQGAVDGLAVGVGVALGELVEGDERVQPGVLLPGLVPGEAGVPQQADRQPGQAALDEIHQQARPGEL